MDEKIWKSGSDVMGVWKKQSYPKTLNKWNVYGDHVVSDEPLTNHRECLHDSWIPPSEDPHYQKKWAYWKGLFAKES